MSALRAVLAGRALLDRITIKLLKDFSAENDLDGLPEDQRFEHLSAYSVVRRHYSRTFATSDIVLGGGGDGDGGIDAVAIIVNNVLVTDADEVHELAAQNDYVEPVFIFVQSERTEGFSAQKISNFGFGVLEFFSETPRAPRSAEVTELRDIINAIISYSGIIRPAKAYLYYVTTGLWKAERALVARCDGVLDDLRALSFFEPEMICMGAAELHEAYRRTRNPISRSFDFGKRTEIPPTDGIIASSIGYIPFSEFKEIVSDESGNELLTSLFDDNVRDWQGPKGVNEGIQKTLLSDDRSKFVLMNNGVTIITKNLTTIGDKFTISEYQIVNGCQTTNVLFSEKDKIGDEVAIRPRRPSAHRTWRGGPACRSRFRPLRGQVRQR